MSKNTHNTDGAVNVDGGRQVVRPRLLRTKEAAIYLAMSPWALRQEVERGELSYISAGDHTSAWRFDIHDLDTWIEAHRLGSKMNS